MRHPKSIILDEHCDILHWLDGDLIPDNLEKHHIFAGARRSMSEENGFVVYLAPYNHTGNNPHTNPLHIRGVHFNAELDRLLKAICQDAYLHDHGPEEWMALVGRNYIWDDAPMDVTDKKLLRWWSTWKDWTVWRDRHD